jgi:hypothetical protein
MITTDDLIRLGFERMDVSAEDSGDMPFYYFSRRFTYGLDLLSISDNERVSDEWIINVMGDHDVWIDDVDDLGNLINILNKIQA